jgi:WD40 repeat protein
MNTAPAKINPFPGLRPFARDEDYLFFGREEQTLELVRRLTDNRFVAVVGSSGSGKSSLVRCGLLSELLGGRMLAAGAAWEVAVTHPGGNPLALLADALLDADLYDRAADSARENLLATLGRSHFGLVEAVKQAGLADGTNVLLVVDQFEELFRFHEAGQRQQEAANEFVSLLLEAVAQTAVPVYVVLTMRSDFIGECGQFEGLAELVNRAEFLIPRLTRDQYKRIVEGPVKVAGGRLAPRLLQRLLNDLGQQADQLPCLQHALMRTWDVWAATGAADALDLDDYQRVGRMAHALSLHADEVYHALADDRQRALCRGLFQALTVEESNGRGVRRPQRLGRLCQILDVPAEGLRPVIDAYRQCGVTFLMPSPEVALTDQTIVDISHESLMRVWVRLRQWVEEETQAAGIYERLSESADLHAAGKAGLYRDPELGIAVAWREAKRPNAAWAERYRPGFAAAMAFLDASREAAEREERDREAARQRELDRARELAATQARAARLFKRFAGGLAAGLCLAVGLTVWAVLLGREAKRQEEEANRQRATADSYSAQAITQAKMAEENANEALSARDLARRAEQKAQESEKDEKKAKTRAEDQLTRAEWLVYIGQLKSARDEIERGDASLARLYLDGCQWNLRGWEHRYLRARLDGQQVLVNNAPVNNVAVQCVAISPDGRRIVAGGGRWDPDAQPPVFESDLTVWDAETGLEIRALKGHRGPVSGVAFSPDGTRIVTGSNDGSAKVWDADAYQELQTLNGHRADVRSVAFSPDGTRIVTGSNDGTAKVWDADTYRELRTLMGHRKQVTGVAFSADGSRLVTASEDTTARVWDARTYQELHTLKGHNGAVTSVAFSPDGSRLVTGSGDSTAKIWDAETYRELHTLKGHLDSVRGVTFSPDGTRIVTASADKTARVWESVTYEEVHTLKGHRNQVVSVAISPDGRRVVTGSSDSTARVWVADRSQELPPGNRRTPERSPQIPTLWGHGDGVCAIAFSPDSKRIVTGSSGNDRDKTAKVWDADTCRELHTLSGHNGDLKSVGFSPDGTRIVTGSSDGTAKVWDAGTYRELHTLAGHGGGVRGVAFSPDGKRIVTGSNDGTARVWDADTYHDLHTLAGHNGAVSSVAFSPDGTRIVTASDDATARVWDARTYHELHTLTGHRDHVRSVAFSPDGTRIVTASDDTTAKVWDAGTGRELRTLGGHTAKVYGVAYTSDGQRIVTGSADKTARLWDAEAGQELFALRGTLNHVLSVACSPDGRRIATGSWDLSAKVWDAGKGWEPFTFDRADNTLCVAFSPDGKRVATGSTYARARLWDAQKGLELLTLQGHAGPVTRVAFSADGRRIFAWDERKRALAWSVADGTPVDPAGAPPEPPSALGRSPDGFRQAVPARPGLDDPAGLVTIDSRRPQNDDNAWPLPDAAERKRYHTNQAWFALYREQKPQWFAAESHLARVLRDDPADAGARAWVAKVIRDRPPVLLQAGDDTASNIERLLVARIARDRERFALATRLWARALESDPALGDNRLTRPRYNAARAAAQAAAGRGSDPPLDDGAKAKLRGQALDWLKAEWTVWRALLDSQKPLTERDTVSVRETLDLLIDLSLVTDKPDEAKKWQAERAKYPDLAPPPREKR